MASNKTPATRKPVGPAPSSRLVLNEVAIRAAKASLDDGAVTPHLNGPWTQDILALLNGALATELVCVLRYRRHHFMASACPCSSVACTRNSSAIRGEASPLAMKWWRR